MVVTIHCDSSQVDEALRKMDELLEKSRLVKGLADPSITFEGGGPVSAGVMMAAGIAGAAAAPKRFSRRSLFGFGWRRS